MIAFTVDEACAFKKGIAQEKEFKKEYPTFRVITNLFRLWFIVLTSIKALFVATIIVSLFNNQPDLIYAWNQGWGFAGLIVYLVASCIDLFRLVDIGVFIAVIIGVFAVGDGIGANFVPFLLPILLCYALSFGLILASNYAINAILEKRCPKIYKALAETIKEIQIRKQFNQFF